VWLDHRAVMVPTELSFFALVDSVHSTKSGSLGHQAMIIYSTSHNQQEGRKNRPFQIFPKISGPPQSIPTKSAGAGQQRGKENGRLHCGV